jgi:hypothetical protein
MFRSALYRGELVHARRDAHAKRTFRYPVYMAAIDPDELPALDRGLRLFSHNRGNLFALRDRDYATDVPALVAGNALPAPHATRLVTNLRTCGYVFNPVSFFLNYGAGGELSSAIAEVNNTYGGSFRYVLGPAERVAGEHARFRHVRELFVSPFLHGPLEYEFVFDAPLDGAEVTIAMHVRDDAGRAVFYARFAGRRTPLSDRALAAAALRYPAMAAQVIGLIYWQALKLHLARVPYLRPGPDQRPRRDSTDRPRGRARVPAPPSRAPRESHS